MRMTILSIGKGSAHFGVNTYLLGREVEVFELDKATDRDPETGEYTAPE